MLSAAKVKIHGMQDERWVIKDKIAQYRGLIKLYERDRKIHEGDLAKQKKRYLKDIRQLRKIIQVKRDDLGIAVYGDKQFTRNALQDNRRLQLAYLNSSAEKVLECIDQENFNRRKQLDKMKFAKKLKMERFRTLQLEAAELKDRVLHEVNAKLPVEKKEQAVANSVQAALLRKNAALAIKAMYEKILDILRKDASYYTVILEALKVDCRAQGKCLVGATEMGQLAMEYLDDRKFEYDRLEKQIKVNMKERKRTLVLVQNEVKHLSSSFPKLIRKDEANNLDDLYDNLDAGSTHSVHAELEDVLATCKQLQRETLVSSFEEIIVRLKEQTYQSTRLRTQLTLNNLKRNALVDDKKHAMVMLDSLKNIGQEETLEYVNRKKFLRSALAAEKREEEALFKSLDEKGHLIIDMKTSLQQLVHLLSVVNLQVGKKRLEVPVKYALDDKLQEVPEVEADFEKLISTAKYKIGLLQTALARVEVNDQIKATAESFYHGVIVRAVKENWKDDVVAEGALIEFEMDDPNVPTYNVIKLKSKQLVEAQVSEFDVVEPAKK